MASSNSFGTFLETRDLLRKSERPSRGGAAKPAIKRGGASPASDVEPLSFLASRESPVDVSEILAETGEPITEVMERLGRLEAAGLIAFKQSDGQPIAFRQSDGHSLVELTEQGAALVS